MAGSYCRFCGRRCFVYRVLPDQSWSGHMATCPSGMALDREKTGYDHTTAINPMVSTTPEMTQTVGDALDAATALRPAVEGRPEEGPYPSTVDEVADEVVAWLRGLDRRAANGVMHAVLMKLGDAMSTDVPPPGVAS